MRIIHKLTGREQKQRMSLHDGRYLYTVETLCGMWIDPRDNDDIGDDCKLCAAAEVTDKPTHYTETAIECIDAIRTTLGEEGFRQYCRGNVIKYAWRAGKKGNFKEDMTKAVRFAMWAAGTDWRETEESEV